MMKEEATGKHNSRQNNQQTLQNYSQQHRREDRNMLTLISPRSKVVETDHEFFLFRIEIALFLVIVG